MTRYHLHLFSNCRIVDGFGRSVIQDLQRGKLRPIPKGLAKRLKKYQNRPYEKILQEEDDDKKLLEDSLITLRKEGYITFLQDHELPHFPELELRYEAPRELETLIVQYHPIEKEYLNPFEDLGLHNLVWLRTHPIDAKTLHQLLDRMQETGPENLILIFDRPVELKNELLDTIERRPRITQCVFFGADKAKKSGNTIEHHPYPFEWNRGPFLMVPKMELYMESLHHQSYFNKKLFLSPEGYLEPSYASKERLLHIDEAKSPSSIRELILKNPFQKLWKIRKEKTLVCKDCEFRRNCVDPRIPLFDPETGYWRHENPCPYNPYINKWEGEPGFRSLEECGVGKDPTPSANARERIHRIEQELWESP